jgi:hypothetical protein
MRMHHRSVHRHGVTSERDGFVEQSAVENRNRGFLRLGEGGRRRMHIEEIECDLREAETLLQLSCSMPSRLCKMSAE